MSLKVCFLLLGLGVGGCVAFGDIPPPPEAESGDDSLYTCFTALDCVLKDTEDYEQLRKCTDPLDDQDFEIGLQFLDKDAQISEFSDHMDALDNKYCVLAPEPRKEQFKKMLNGVLEIYSLGCESKLPKSTCDHYAEITDCVSELIDKINKEGKCDIKEFDAQFD